MLFKTSGLSLPATAQRLYQGHRGGLPVSHRLRKRSPGVEGSSLGIDNFGIAHLTAAVTVENLLLDLVSRR